MHNSSANSAVKPSTSLCRIVPHEASKPSDAASLTYAAFMKVGHAVAIIGHDGRVLLSNPIFLQLFEGHHAAALLGQFQNDDVAAERHVAFPNGRTIRIRKVPLEQGYFLSASDVTDALGKKAREAEAARTDHLTQLGNRLLFRERLSALLDKPGSISGQTAILTIDLQRFKAINDSLGRGIGDALLCLVSRRIRSAVQPNDVLARLDGDEFGIIQADQPQPAAAAALAARLVDLLSRPYLLDGQLINIAACVGIALSTDDRDCDLMLKNADLALHRAKDDGHGAHRFFEAAMDQRMRARRALEIDLRRALALREFSLAYQPQLDLKSKRVSGFEALLRWQCPTRGPVAPNDFIALAEETGVIVPIGEWVVRNACREAVKWPADCSVAVNVSAVQFGCPNLVATIVSALAESGLDPRRLELEITESVMLDAHGKALAKLQNLRALGVRVSLDDFGTGYSSLGYLRSFPFDKIKIDQSFVRGAPDDLGGRAIVRAIASLGQSLGMATVAEGVETRTQMTDVTADGCTAVQGYYVSRPMRSDQIGDFLASSCDHSPDRIG